ncbi:squalene--hopene cyclase [Syntrophotalea carbinolica]|nr:squalene--hopene cyclase [Syntrophotalea carbinolica]
MKNINQPKFRVFRGGQKAATPCPGTTNERRGALDRGRLSASLKHSREWLLSLQADAGNWVFALEADTTIASEYVMLQRFLGRPLAPELQQRLANYLLSRQLPDGGWPLYAEDGFANISTTVKAYLALKLLGYPTHCDPLVRARQIVLALGGAEKCNVFTRIALALFGQIPWRTTPAMPVEIMLLPRWFYFHLSKISYWARTVVVPLLILYAKRPVCRLEPWEGIPELFVTPPDKLGYLDVCKPGQWRKNVFIWVDRLTRKMVRCVPRRLHNLALRAAETWTREHMQGAGGIGAIFPAMANAVMALRTLGCSPDDADYQRGLKALDDLLIDRCDVPPREDTPVSPCWCTGTSAAPMLDPSPAGSHAQGGDQGICQPCASPIWDTGLALTALLEGGLDARHPAVDRAVRWLLDQQVDVKGDWAQRVPNLEAGGWAFQFENALYPDLDDTSKVLMSLIRAGAMDNPGYRQELSRAINWVIGMQNSDGGWGAFDVDNNYLYLNDIPFADHGALLDPSTADVTGRCIEMLAMAGFGRDFLPIARGVDFLRREQEDFGGWYGRWGVNYIYGTWSALSGLIHAGEDLQAPYIRQAVGWLESVQNPDGGWGETCYSYDDPALAGRGVSTASQTAWALLGLMAAGEVDNLAVRRGIQYLVEEQNRAGGWDERHFTGTGFPRVFYLRYHGYSQYFPLWALGLYERLSSGNPSRQQMVRRAGPAGLHLPVLDRRKKLRRKRKA